MHNMKQTSWNTSKGIDSYYVLAPSCKWAISLHMTNGKSQKMVDFSMTIVWSRVSMIENLQKGMFFWNLDFLSMVSTNSEIKLAWSQFLSKFCQRSSFITPLQALIGALHENRTLRHLDLAENRVGFKVAEAGPAPFSGPSGETLCERWQCKVGIEF